MRLLGIGAFVSWPSPPDVWSYVGKGSALSLACLLVGIMVVRFVWRQAHRVVSFVLALVFLAAAAWAALFMYLSYQKDASEHKQIEQECVLSIPDYDRLDDIKPGTWDCPLEYDT